MENPELDLEAEEMEMAYLLNEQQRRMLSPELIPELPEDYFEEIEAGMVEDHRK